VLVTGFDIIFFWVARMVMATQYFTGKVPFREVYINAIVRDAEGQKMSKSKGNTVDPLDLIDGIDLESLVKKSTASLLIPQVREKVEKRIRKDYPGGIPAVGADALRFTFAALATYGRTINFDLKRADGYRNFCNKLWNAARFVLMNTEGNAAALPQHPNPTLEGAGLKAETEAERWILTRLHHTLAEVEAHFATYRFDLLAQALYEFTWNEFCDWFLELTKPALNAGDEPIAGSIEGPAPAKSSDAAESTRRTLLHVLETLLRALHPIIPFVTEEIWHAIAPKLGAAGDTISLRPYPLAAEIPTDADAEAEIEWLKAVLTQVRRIRSEMNIAPSKTIPLLFSGGSESDRMRTVKFASQIEFLARAEPPRWLAAVDAEPAAAAAIVGEMKLLIPLAGLIDIEAEKARLAREIKRVEGEIEKSNAKLGKFGPNTPAAVVEQEKQRLADFTTTLAGLREQSERLARQ